MSGLGDLAVKELSMDALYVWPDQPGLSLLLVWLASTIFLWSARDAMLKLMRGLGASADDGFRALADWSASRANLLRKRNRAALLAAGGLELHGRLDREFHRIDHTFSEKLGQYAKLHRKLDDLLSKLESDYGKCGEAPPEVPGWTTAVETIARIPAAGDPNVQKVLEGMRRSSHQAERKALQAYRDDTAKRHRTLGAMAPGWKLTRGLMARLKDCVTKALESTRRINGYIEDYEKIQEDQESAARALTYSAGKLFTVSLLVLGVALGGAFVNFQLIALPMSELVPAGARLGGFPVSMVSALVIVLMEIALGIFIMDMLGVTDLFPKLAAVPAARRRLILGLALSGLFLLASVESSLAVLRERIVEADVVLKLSLAGEESRLVTEASSSMIPVVGQAVLGFVLPWVLAMVAIPLEMMLDSGRHVATSLIVLLMSGLGHAARIFAYVANYMTVMLVHLYDVYISIPLRIERMIRSHNRSSGSASTTESGSEQRSEATA